MTTSQEFDLEVWEVLRKMALAIDFSATREVAKQHIHLCFDPEFFPALFRCLQLMAQSDQELEPIATGVLAAYLLELRDFFEHQRADTLSPNVIYVELLVRSGAAQLETDTRDPGVELMKGILRHELTLSSHRKAFAAEIERIAVAAEGRGHGESGISRSMREFAEQWRKLPQLVEVCLQLLELTALPSEQIAQAIRAAPELLESPLLSMAAAGYVRKALEETDARRALEAEKTLLTITGEGFGTDRSSIDSSLRRAALMLFDSTQESEKDDELADLLNMLVGETSLQRDASSPSVDEIIEVMEQFRADYTTLNKVPDALAIEQRSPAEKAILALVEQWTGRALEQRVAGSTIRNLIAHGAGVTTEELQAGITRLIDDGLLDVATDSDTTPATHLEWSAAGRPRCWAYLNRWGWEKLAMALDDHRLPIDGGPPLMGGQSDDRPGGWSSENI